MARPKEYQSIMSLVVVCQLNFAVRYVLRSLVHHALWMAVSMCFDTGRLLMYSCAALLGYVMCAGNGVVGVMVSRAFVLIWTVYESTYACHGVGGMR